MSQFCSLDEAFTGPVMPPPGGKKKKTGRSKDSVTEPFVPSQLSSTPLVDPDRPAARPGPVPAPMTGPDAGGNAAKFEEATNLHELFPLPGDTADADEWTKAFMLEPTQIPQLTRPDGAVPVAGKPTLWRKIPEPVPTASTAIAPIVDTLVTVPSEINQRLDTLTRQLEALTTPSPIQSTAELFLFVAIGLLILLGIDTILRFATSIATRGMRGGGRRWPQRWSR